MSNPNANVRKFDGAVNAAAYWIYDHLLRAGDIVNDSTVTGTTVKAALNTLSAASSAVFPFVAAGLAEQDLVSYDASAATWRNRTKVAALKGTGTDSFVVGTGSFAAGTNDIILGPSAGNVLNTGSNNIGIGIDVLDGATAALQNIIAIGNSALSDALTSAANGTIAIGSYNLLSLTSGAKNTSVGHLNATTLISGSRNTFFGYAISSFNTTDDNTLIGDEVGSNNNGSRNTAVGSQAFNSASVAVTDCVALGYNALTGIISTTAPSGSVAIGSSALSAVTTGLNTAVGYVSGISITTGTRNTLLGYATDSAAASNDNTFIGHAAGNNVSGGLNVAIGSNAFNSLAGPANSCVVIGADALTVNGSGTISGAVAIGYAALSVLVNGTANTAVGYQAGNILTSGSNMTILGYNADGDSSGRAGCVVLGTNALATADDTLVIRVGNTSTTELKSTLAITAKGGRTGAVAADTDYLTVIIGGVTRYIELKTTP